MKLNCLKYVTFVTVIFRQYDFRLISFKIQIPKFHDLSSIEPDFFFKILYLFRCLFIFNARVNCIKCLNIKLC